MQLTARIEILTQSTMSSPRPARLIITGDGDEYECENALKTLLSAKLQQPTPQGSQLETAPVVSRESAAES